MWEIPSCEVDVREGGWTSELEGLGLEPWLPCRPGKTDEPLLFLKFVPCGEQCLPL